MVESHYPCEWAPAAGGVACVHCGTRRPAPILRACALRPVVAAVCPHLGPAYANDAGDGPATVLVPCNCGGDAARQRPAVVHECRAFPDAAGDPGECLPRTRGMTAKQLAKYEARDDAVRLCDRCDLRPVASVVPRRRQDDAQQVQDEPRQDERQVPDRHDAEP